jgi:hypothetical protein
MGTLAIPGDYLVEVQGPLRGNSGHTWRLSDLGGARVGALAIPGDYIAKSRAPCVRSWNPGIPIDHLVHVEVPLCGNSGHTWRQSGPGGGPPVREHWPYLATIWSSWRAPCEGILAIPGDYLVQVEDPFCGNPLPYLATIWSRWRDPCVGTLAIPGDYLVQVEGPLCWYPVHTWRLFGLGGGSLL